MIELTQRDMDAIGHITAKAGPLRTEAIYRAGLAAGIARAAQHMESESTNTAIKIRALLK